MTTERDFEELTAGPLGMGPRRAAAALRPTERPRAQAAKAKPARVVRKKPVRVRPKEDVEECSTATLIEEIRDLYFSQKRRDLPFCERRAVNAVLQAGRTDSLKRIANSMPCTVAALVKELRLARRRRIHG